MGRKSCEPPLVSLSKPISKSETALPWGHVRPIFPTAAGRISRDRIKEVVKLYGKDVVIIVGGGLLPGGPDITSSCQALMKQVEHLH
jgi:ribulose-bisphosphate carboxylase large chain